MFLNANDIQLGRGEPIKDTARVLGRMIHGAVIRTFAQSDVEEFAEFSGIPTINALTDDEHPCQILADIFTFQEKRGPIAGKVVAFIGDGACNVANSWIFAAAKLEFELRIAAPKKFQPSAGVVEARRRENCLHRQPGKGGEGRGPALHRRVGFDGQGSRSRRSACKILTGYQINQKLVKLAKPDALVMHCLPAYRGKEIDEETFEANARHDFHAGGKPAARAEGDFELGGFVTVSHCPRFGCVRLRSFLPGEDLHRENRKFSPNPARLILG